MAHAGILIIASGVYIRLDVERFEIGLALREPSAETLAQALYAVPGRPPSPAEQLVAVRDERS